MATTNVHESDDSPCVLAVIVLYGQRLHETKAFQSLMGAVGSAVCPVSLLIWDNSPTESEWECNAEVLDRLEAFKYFADPTNPGLVKAYNHGLELAIEQKCSWLLTLDQDTDVPDHYFKAFVQQFAYDKHSVAHVPFVVEGDRHCSPVRVVAGLPCHLLPIKTHGNQKRPITALNSGAFVSVGFLKRIGGYSLDYQLDYVDHWLFREVFRHGKEVSILPIQLQHRLSVNTFKDSVSTSRYASILESQNRFARNSESFIPLILLCFKRPIDLLVLIFRMRSLTYVSIAVADGFRLVKALAAKVVFGPSNR